MDECADMLPALHTQGIRVRWEAAVRWSTEFVHCGAGVLNRAMLVAADSY